MHQMLIVERLLTEISLLYVTVVCNVHVGMILFLKIACETSALCNLHCLLMFAVSKICHFRQSSDIKANNPLIYCARFTQLYRTHI